LLSLLAFLYWTCGTVVRSLLPLRLDELGTSSSRVGFYMSLAGALALAAALPLGRLTDRVGSGIVLVAGLAGLLLCGLAFAVVSGVAAIVVVLLLSGVAELGAWIALQALIGGAGDGRFRDRQMSMFSLGWGLGLTIGPFLGAAVYEGGGLRAASLIYAAAAAVALALSRWVPTGAGSDSDGAPDVAHAKPGLGELMARPGLRLALLASFLNVFMVAVNTSFYPLLLHARGIEVRHIGLLLSVFGVSSLLVRVFIPTLQWRFGAARVLAGSMIGCAVTLIIVPFLGSVPAFMGAAVFSGACTGVSPPLTVGLSIEHTRTHERGAVMGLRAAANRLSVVLQPLAFSLAVALVGVANAFVVIGLGLTTLTTLIGIGTLRQP
jgi:MFS family permease